MSKINRISSNMIDETRAAKVLPPVWLTCLIFLVAFYLGQMIEGVITAIPMLPKMFMLISERSIESFADIMELTGELLNDPSIMLTLLFSTVFGTAIMLVACRVLQKRSWASIGFAKKNAVGQYLIGAALGVGMVLAVYGIASLFVRVESVRYNGITFTIVLYLFAFMLQSAGEEILLRGFLMNNIAAKKSIVLGLVLNSAIFGVLHLLNPGMQLLPLLNIVIIGLVFSLLSLYYDNIWVACGMHFSWNFMVSNVMGSNVSGMEVPDSLFTVAFSGRGIVTGGSFGPEGSLLVTLVGLAICVVYYVLLINRRVPADPCE